MVIAIDFKLENNAAAFLYGASTKSFVIQNGPKTLMMDFFSDFAFMSRSRQLL